MMRATCPREVEVVASVVERGRAGGDDGDLCAHLESCDTCREVAMLTRLMTSDRDHAGRVVRVPAAGQVWWRAAVRARLEAVHAAARPLTWSQSIAGACAVGLAIAMIGLVWPSLRDATAVVATYTLHTVPFEEATTLLSGAWRSGVTAMFVAAACLVVAPVAVYFVLSDE